MTLFFLVLIAAEFKRRSIEVVSGPLNWNEPGVIGYHLAGVILGVMYVRWTGVSQPDERLLWVVRRLCGSS